MFFFPALTAMVGYWATLRLEYSRLYAVCEKQESQTVGQAFGLPVAMVLYSFLGYRGDVGFDSCVWHADLEPC